MFNINIVFNVKGVLLKKNISALVIPTLVMISVSAFAATNEGETSSVTFKGSIKENTCVLGKDSVAQIVELGDVESSVLAKTGLASQPTSFTISLNECASASASVTFSGDTANDESLKVIGGATGVGIQILENGKPLKVDGSASSVVKKVGADSANDFTFSARYIALDDTIEPGEANATAQFTVKYE